MRIKIKNFGPIHEYEFDLKKDFHLIVGKNNVGKSYAITLIYLILKNILNMKVYLGLEYIHLFRNRQLSLYQEETATDKIIQKLSILKKGQQLHIDSEIEQSIAELLSSTFLPVLSNTLKNSFNSLDNLSNQFGSDSFTVELLLDTFSVQISQNENELTIKDSKLLESVCIRGIQQYRKSRIKQNQRILYFNQKDRNVEKFLEDYSELIGRYCFELHVSAIKFVGDLHFLPASRSGLYQALSAFSQIIVELSQKRNFLTKKIELPSISEPLSDYFLKISEIKVHRKKYQHIAVNNIAQEIEQDILNGSVEFDPKPKKLFFHPDGTNLKLDLSETSSMVSELSPIVSFLRYIITVSPNQSRTVRDVKNNVTGVTSKHLIIIEEPEAHLHPEIQIKLTEIFSKLIGAEVKIIITTHSNYIFNKVNNLILDEGFNPDDLSAVVFKATEKGSIGLELNTDDLGIDDDNFIEAAESLYEEKIELIEKLNQVD